MVDLRDGKTWGLEPQGSPTSDYPRGALLGWSPAGEALVGVTGFGRSLLYLGAPGQPFRKFAEVAASSASWSPDGVLVAVGTTILDGTSGNLVAELPDDARTVGGWSPDSRYLQFTSGPSDAQGLGIWDRLSGSIAHVQTLGGAWSGKGDELAYVQASSLTPTNEQEFVVRERNMLDGTDVALTTLKATSAGVGPWSPDGRFLAVNVFATHVQGNFTVGTQDVRIIDTTQPHSQTIVHGAWAGVWLPDGKTLLFTGNVCSTFDILAVDVESGDLRRYTSSTDMDLYPHLSPDGKQVAFTTYDLKGGSVIRLLNLTTGGISDVESGSGISLWGVSPNTVWSADGRYLTLGFDAGHGACEAAEPQTTSVEQVQVQ